MFSRHTGSGPLPTSWFFGNIMGYFTGWKEDNHYETRGDSDEGWLVDDHYHFMGIYDDGDDDDDDDDIQYIYINYIYRKHTSYYTATNIILYFGDKL